MKLPWRLVAVCLLSQMILMLAGCGQSGRLYLAPSTEQTAPINP